MSDGVSLALWDKFGMRCRATMRCDARMAHGCLGDSVGTDRYIRVHMYSIFLSLSVGP